MRRKPSILKKPYLLLFYKKIVDKNKKIIFLRKMQKWTCVTIISIITALTFLDFLATAEIFFISLIFFVVIFITLLIKINFVKKRISFSKEEFENAIFEVKADIDKEKKDRKPINIDSVQKNINKQKKDIKEDEEKLKKLQQTEYMEFSLTDQQRNEINNLEDDLSIKKADLFSLESAFDLACETLQMYQEKDQYYEESLKAAEDFKQKHFGVAKLEKLGEINKEKPKLRVVKNY